MTIEVAVIGAGIVGVSSALALQKRGLSVTLIDRREPGLETSYGNAGVLSRGSVSPLNGPDIWKSFPAYLGNRHAAVRYHLRHIITHAPWFLRFMAHATRSDAQRRAVALDSLIAPSIDLHRSWMNEAGIGHRIRETGWLKLWPRETADAAREQAILSRFDISSELLDRQGIARIEPWLAPVFSTGLLHRDSASVDSPGAVVSGYASLFAARGGCIMKAEVIDCAPTTEGWRLRLHTGVVAARRIVVALGPWSGDLLRKLGYRVPLAFERGYHREFRPHSEHRLLRPILDVEGAYVMTPMENRIRITSGVEFADRDAPSSFEQIDAAVVRARNVLPLGEPIAEPWRGSRPSLPDSLPVIGPAPRHANLWLGFGHHHIGFSTGPSTGEALASLICGGKLPFDPVPFRPARYL